MKIKLEPLWNIVYHDCVMSRFKNSLNFLFVEGNESISFGIVSIKFFSSFYSWKKMSKFIFLIDELSKQIVWKQIKIYHPIQQLLENSADGNIMFWTSVFKGYFSLNA